MWHRSKDVLNNESFWKESSSCATENDQFWRISGTMAPAVLASERSKQRSLRCSFTSLVSVTTRGKQRVTILLLPGAGGRSPDICPEVPPVNHAGCDSLSMSVWPPLWPLMDEMKEWNPACQKKHHISSSAPPQNTPTNYIKASIIFTPYLINPSLRLSQCSFFFFSKSNLIIYSEAFRRSFPVTADWCVWLNHLQWT